MNAYLCPYCGEFSAEVQDYSYRSEDLHFPCFQVVCSDCQTAGPEGETSDDAEDSWQSMCRNLCARGAC